MPDITVQIVVKNEEKWLWFAIESILHFAKKIIIYDTGSTDNTVEIIKSFKSNKIIFEQKGSIDAKQLVDLRALQLKMTTTEWFMLLDGDEIWPQASLDELSKILKSTQKDTWGIVVRAWNFIGDVYHYHPESIHYHWPFAPKSFLGWANLRVMRRSIPNLHLEGTYPLEAYCSTSVPIQNYPKHLIFAKNRYFHATYLVRSKSRLVDKKVLNRSKKAKMELGYSFQNKIEYPKSFYQEKPDFVDSPWEKRTFTETFLAAIQTPLKESRRRLLGLYYPHAK